MIWCLNIVLETLKIYSIYITLNLFLIPAFVPLLPQLRNPETIVGHSKRIQLDYKNFISLLIWVEGNFKPCQNLLIDYLLISFHQCFAKMNSILGRSANSLLQLELEVATPSSQNLDFFCWNCYAPWIKLNRPISCGLWLDHQDFPLEVISSIQQFGFDLGGRQVAAFIALKNFKSNIDSFFIYYVMFF